MSPRPKRPKTPDGKMTIGELARRTGMTVRNIRAHQTRGLLPPPEVHGRTGYYNEEHVARIELTREMQAEGLNLEAIRRVLESTEGSSAEIVDFARAVRAPFEDETPEIFEPAELAEIWGVEGARPEADPPRRKARHPARAARRQDRGDQPAPAARRRRPGRARRQPRGDPRHRRQAAPPGRRRRPHLRRPLRQGDLGAVRQGRPPRGGLAEGARGPRPHAPLASDAVLAMFQIAMGEATEKAGEQTLRNAAKPTKKRSKRRGH